MKFAVIFLALCACSAAQIVGVSTVGSSGATTAVTSPYQFPDTPVGEGNSVVLTLRDAAAAPIEIVTVLVSNSSGSALADPNFTTTGTVIGKILSTDASSNEPVTVSFVPGSQGAITGYLTVIYELQQNGCILGSTTPATECPALTASVVTLQGNGTAPALVVSYAGPSGQTQLMPFASSPLDFGNVSTSSSEKIVFTIANDSSTSVATPNVSLQTPVFASSAFALDTSALPAELAASSSATFTITFAPGQLGLATTTLLIGTLSFPIQGTGAVVQADDALQIYYVDSTGVRTSPQTATPISFGQIVAGATTPNVLTFTVTNPSTSLDPIQIGTLSVTGTSFTAAGFPALPETLQPGQSFTFTISFAGGAAGSYPGQLSIGSRTFALTGSSIASLIPQATLQVDVQPLTSQLQAHLSIQLGSAAAASVVGELTMTFAPSVANVTDDPAILFVASNSRTIQVSVAAGAQTATFNGQSALAFQTGTTAGTITFTLTFPNSAPVSSSFTIAPEQVQITTVTAVQQDPYLVVTLTGFDNTYSTGKLAFSFTDVNGNSLTASPIAVDATSAFSQYFFTNDQSGGAFSMQAKFPVTGSVANVGSVSAQISNTQGTTTVSQSFE